MTAVVTTYVERSPAERMRLGLDLQRAQGVAFGEAWARVHGSLRLGEDRESRDWRSALSATKQAFSRAYYGAPATAAEQAAVRLIALVRHHVDASPH